MGKRAGASERTERRAAAGWADGWTDWWVDGRGNLGGWLGGGMGRGGWMGVKGFRTTLPKIRHLGIKAILSWR